MSSLMIQFSRKSSGIGLETVRSDTNKRYGIPDNKACQRLLINRLIAGKVDGRIHSLPFRLGNLIL
jgi:hypothetical protein